MATVHDTIAPSPAATADDAITSAEKKDVAQHRAASIEDGEIMASADPEKTFYSKTSVWLMVLFSGLAIGSDG